MDPYWMMDRADLTPEDLVVIRTCPGVETGTLSTVHYTARRTQKKKRIDTGLELHLNLSTSTPFLPSMT
eukprot:scaffold51957_cov55-Attheya_sp.AAC.2